MRKLSLIILTLFLCWSCITKRHVEKAVNTGHYDQAINTALNKLKTNKNKKRKADYIYKLQEAYIKATQRDLSTIAHLKKDGNPEAYKDILEIYLDLEDRQEAIKPVLPLYVGHKNIPFKFNNYTSSIIEAKNNTSQYLYNKALNLLNTTDKLTFREAYYTLDYVQNINPNYKNTTALLKKAHFLGTHHILVSINNQTQQIIPRRLENDLLNFDTYGLNKFWSRYHANNPGTINFDYSMQLNLKRIFISPERIQEREYIREKDVVDGWRYALDRRGNVLKDSLGNDIKVENVVRVQCRLIESLQSKSVQVVGDVVYLNLKTNNTINRFPIDSQFVFEYAYANARGDRRALLQNDRLLINNRPVPFPSNEQMVYDTGEDLKRQLKIIIQKSNL